MRKRRVPRHEADFVDGVETALCVRAPFHHQVKAASCLFKMQPRLDAGQRLAVHKGLHGHLHRSVQRQQGERAGGQASKEHEADLHVLHLVVARSHGACPLRNNRQVPVFVFAGHPHVVLHAVDQRRRRGAGVDHGFRCFARSDARHGLKGVRVGIGCCVDEDVMDHSAAVGFDVPRHPKVTAGIVRNVDRRQVEHGGWGIRIGDFDGQHVGQVASDAVDLPRTNGVVVHGAEFNLHVHRHVSTDVRVGLTQVDVGPVWNAVHVEAQQSCTKIRHVLPPNRDKLGTEAFQHQFRCGGANDLRCTVRVGGQQVRDAEHTGLGAVEGEGNAETAASGFHSLVHQVRQVADFGRVLVHDKAGIVRDVDERGVEEARARAVQGEGGSDHGDAVAVGGSCLRGEHAGQGILDGPDHVLSNQGPVHARRVASCVTGRRKFLRAVALDVEANPVPSANEDARSGLPGGDDLFHRAVAVDVGEHDVPRHAPRLKQQR